MWLAGHAARPYGRWIEPFGVKHRPLVVIAQQADFALRDQIHALAGIRPIAHDISETVDVLDGLLRDVLEDRLEGLEVAMDIADDRLHNSGSPGGRSARPQCDG